MDHEEEQAFLEINRCLMELPTLIALQAGEPLTLYLLASYIAIGAVLLTDRKNLQTLIYHVSRTLTDPETRYSILEKLVLALVYAARRLRRYFQGHPINVLTGYKLKSVLSNPDLSGRDGASSGEGSGVGLRLVNPEGHEFTFVIKLDFKSTNNEAEYEAFLAGLRIAKKLEVKHLEAHVDSMLIAGNINGTYEAKNDVMASYLSQEKDLILQFSSCKVIHIKRS
ncbi:uncharacterized protein LOC143557677 [Bidens hawaiensis]|uniref:uncharacterized protein LOC143557677 n=1 Tax=Bidens hawaiensis TaxID=980011 RepID=UPI00404B6E57